MNLNDKLALLVPSSILTNAIMSNLPDNLKPDPEGLDPSVVDQNQMGLRMDRTIYAWFCLAYNDENLLPKPPEGVSKVALLTIAAIQAAGQIVNYPDEMALDINTLDPTVIQDSSAAWRLFRTRYAWLCASLADSTMWVDAPEGIGNVTGAGTVSLESLMSLLPTALPELMKNKVLVDTLKAAFLGS